ncbi:hypothetical protein OHA72_09785 [Dactylosporangium sp. NBC_01737]|uniref:hypothetical protein n=1 Tax=Dactylosporangium sp. NBC_01737 TaxID=2975959 RepID=UPI002E0E7135|nr:hypothetical protein OHA72_09785 [Dactylosporangium sp. NBC_01737]
MQQPNNGHYALLALLALLPPAAGFLVWRAVEHLSGHEYAWSIVGAGVVAGIATTAVWARRVRTSVAAKLAVAGFLTEFGLEFVAGQVRGGVPALVAGASEAFLAGALLVGEVVLALWIHGNYRFEAGHRVSVWLLQGHSGHDPDYYQAFCECTWQSDRFEVEDGDDSEERAFEVAREHSPTVRSDVAVKF